MLKCWGTGTTAIFGADNRPHEQLEPDMCVAEQERLIEFVFGDALSDPIANLDRLKAVAILCPRNTETFELNNEILVNFYYIIVLIFTFIFIVSHQIPCEL